MVALNCYCWIELFYKQRREDIIELLQEEQVHMMYWLKFNEKEIDWLRDGDYNNLDVDDITDEVYPSKYHYKYQYKHIFDHHKKHFHRVKINDTDLTFKNDLISKNYDDYSFRQTNIMN